MNSSLKNQIVRFFVTVLVGGVLLQDEQRGCGADQREHDHAQHDEEQLFALLLRRFGGDSGGGGGGSRHGVPSTFHTVQAVWG